jgi:thiol-disulfide isomerase/thioredoxin
MTTSRRQLALVIAGAAAGAAGLRWSLRDSTGGAVSGLKPTEQAIADFWQRSFTTPSGANLSAQVFQGRPLIVNFWATWCPPCVKEMPELDRFARQFGTKGWQVLGLAVDQSAAVAKFLQQTPVSFPIALAGVEGLSLVRALGNPAGGLPFTVAISAQGLLIANKIGATNIDELSAWAQI